MRKPKIHYINYGIGFTVCEGKKPLYIELNKNLRKRKYSKFKKQVLAHEMLHWKSRSLINDFKIDILDAFNYKEFMEKRKFIRENQGAGLCDSPFFIENGKLVPNYFVITAYSITAILVISAIMLGVKII